MNQQDMAIVKKIFASYYEEADFPIPKIEQREFGFGNIKKIDARHLNFSGVSEFKRYLATNTPLFVSHSTAYYEFPGATPIQKKQWKGADLVFDLDIHAEGKYGAYAKLEEVKNDLIRLVDDFLIGDFGINKNEIILVFSGNRGYHVHVRDPLFLSIGGEERRELVDYIMGQGLDYVQFFAPDDNKRLIGPRPDESGYRGRFARSVIKLIRDKPTAISRLFSKDKNRDFFIGGIEEGNWSKTSLKFNDLVNRFKVVADELPIHSVDTDVGVTQDLSKLIRVPNSIHGETGLVAKIIGDITKFNPWRDAAVKSDRIARIKFIEDVPQLDMVEVGPFKKDSEQKMPQHLAVFFVCKGSAVFVD
ncbi:DNA primase small subunit PriS [Candidatus Bilamarchaeum dharawalense]|uniref:DNA primase small subunit PriS n=1 Tax=Candidatus Bilamarchaeum dharawalense TaxID=2885759 RepID=A0A5E4LNY8_9ARCH|nr:DNA primase small subunit PriS [Candidatus Bilamarchaeum dharawalense]